MNCESLKKVMVYFISRWIFWGVFSWVLGLWSKTHGLGKINFLVRSIARSFFPSQNQLHSIDDDTETTFSFVMKNSNRTSKQNLPEVGRATQKENLKLPSPTAPNRIGIPTRTEKKSPLNLFNHPCSQHKCGFLDQKTPSVCPSVASSCYWIFFFHHPASHSLIRNRQQMKQNSTGAAPISIHSHQGTGSKRIGSDSSRWLPPPLSFTCTSWQNPFFSERNATHRQLPYLGRQATAAVEHKWNPIRVIILLCFPNSVIRFSNFSLLSFLKF